VLPQDAYGQLQLAFRISNYALNQKAGQLENEVQQLRQNLSQKQNQSSMLEQRVIQLENELNESHSKHKMAVEATQKLAAEKLALINTVKKLNRDLAKLEGFKRNLLNSLRDDEDPSAAHQQAMRGYTDTSLASLDLSSDRLISSVLAGANPTQHSTSSSPGSNHGHGMGNGISSLNSAMNDMSMGSPRIDGSRSPQQQRSQAPVSASVGSSPRIDGKEFFRQARARLSYEQFSQFLQNIKELNAGRQTREETLTKARDVFGADNSDLYVSFEGLLSRHLPVM